MPRMPIACIPGTMALRFLFLATRIFTKGKSERPVIPFLTIDFNGHLELHRVVRAITA